jgi:adenine-specific DNA methylase
MLYGAYRDNPKYCEAYIDKETFDKMQDIMKRNLKENTGENRVYIFSGLVKCPHCKRVLAGNYKISYGKGDVVYKYKQYRCGNHRQDAQCDFGKTVNENRLERLMLAEVEEHLKKAKIKSANIEATDIRPLKYDIDDIHEQIDRLNYSWQTGKIRKVEQYEMQYEDLMQKLSLAEAE